MKQRRCTPMPQVQQQRIINGGARDNIDDDACTAESTTVGVTKYCARLLRPYRRQLLSESNCRRLKLISN
eukprot:560537-Prorocentrum_minimum.AAC.1